VLAERTVVEC